MISQYIQSCLDVNSSWVEVFNELSILIAFDYDPMLEGSITADCVATECGVDEATAITGIVQFCIDNNYCVDVECVKSNKDLVNETLNNFGGEGESDYADFIVDNALVQ